MEGDDVIGSHEEGPSGRRVEPDPGAGTRFRQAAAAMAVAGDDETARAHSAIAATALQALAAAGRDLELRGLLTPDPVDGQVTWTVVCRRAGDPEPIDVREYESPSAAVTALGDCGDAEHTAADLVASGNSGLRWRAMVRGPAGTHFDLPGEGSIAAADVAEATVDEALERWERRVARWGGAHTPVPVPVDRPEELAAAIESLAEDAAHVPGEGWALLFPMPGQRGSAETIERIAAGVARLVEQEEARDRRVASLAADVGRLQAIVAGVAETTEADRGAAARTAAEVAALREAIEADRATLAERLAADLAAIATRLEGLEVASASAPDRDRALVEESAGHVVDLVRAEVRATGQDVHAQAAKLEASVRDHTDSLSERLAESERRLGAAMLELAQGTAARVGEAVDDVRALRDLLDQHASVVEAQSDVTTRVLAAVEALPRGASEELSAELGRLSASQQELLAQLDQIGRLPDAARRTEERLGRVLATLRRLANQEAANTERLADLAGVPRGVRRVERLLSRYEPEGWDDEEPVATP